MQQMEEVMKDIDVYVTPSFGRNGPLLTNLTARPAVVVPNGFRSSDNTPPVLRLSGSYSAKQKHSP